MADLLVLLLDPLAAAMHVDGAVLGGGHEPGAGVIRHSGLWPPLEGGDECVLRQILGRTNVARDASQAGNESRRLDSPDGIDDAVDIGHDSLLPRRFWLMPRLRCVRELGRRA